MSVSTWTRENVPAVTVLLSAVALAFVFGAALQVLPADALPQSESLLNVIPHVNAIISLAAIATIATGWRAIRNDDVGRHRVWMIVSFLLFSVFLVLYLYRVAILGPSEFPGPELLRTYVYLPVLVVHVLLAVVCVPFVIYALLLATTRSVPELRETNHRLAGRIAASLWLVSFAMGIIIYAMLYLIY